MIYDAPAEARWLRPEPRRIVPGRVLERIVEAALPGRRVVEVKPLTDGLRNANFSVCLDSIPEPVVLRIYEHAVSLCQKEVDLYQLIRPSVPVPEVIYAEPNGMSEIPPFLVLRYIEGITFRELKHKRNAHSISHAAYAVGLTLGAISGVTFSKPGWLGPGPSVQAPLLEGKNPGPRFVDLCLASVRTRERMERELRDQTSALVWTNAAQLASLDNENRLVHGDFGGRNLLVRQVSENWTVVGVLDWEFAVAGSPLADIGHFLRYECVSRPVLEPHFSEGYLQAGGRLPHDWRRLARLVDLIALCESLTHDSLPNGVVRELLELVRATIENRDPQFA